MRSHTQLSVRAWLSPSWGPAADSPLSLPVFPEAVPSPFLGLPERSPRRELG